jgi:uracil phosphoribosyltransferase
MIHDFSKENSVLQHFVAEMRDVNIQNDRMRFRRNLERAGEILAYEMSRHFTYKKQTVDTPLGEADINLMADNIIMVSVLRAGLPFHNGFLNYFDHADNGFIAAYRANNKDGTFEIRLEYVSCPPIDNSIVILIDPMLATGASLEKAVEELAEHGQWKELHIASVIASRQGVARVERLFPDAHLWLAAVDDELTARSYIVPGLGDAGDLAYGRKRHD